MASCVIFSMAAISPTPAQRVEAQVPPPHQAAKAEMGHGAVPRRTSDYDKERVSEKDWQRRNKNDQSDAILLAEQLTVLETRIGIRVDQLNAWRDYTSALQSLLNAPPPKENCENPPVIENIAEQHKDPFDREQKLADTITGRAVTAARLKDAVAVLRTVLTQQQLQELVAANSERWLRITPDAFGKAGQADFIGNHPEKQEKAKDDKF
jgi:hypothetical protein